MIGFLADEPEPSGGLIALGQVVTIRIDGGEPKTFMLVSESGGQELAGKTTLSSGTPVCAALIGRRAGETVSVAVGSEQITLEIVNCEALV